MLGPYLFIHALVAVHFMQLLVHVTEPIQDQGLLGEQIQDCNLPYGDLV